MGWRPVISSISVGMFVGDAMKALTLFNAYQKAEYEYWQHLGENVILAVKRDRQRARFEGALRKKLKDCK